MSHPGDLRNGKGEKSFFRGNPGMAIDLLWGGAACMLDAVAPETLAGLENLLNVVLLIVVRRGGEWLLQWAVHFYGQFGWLLTPF